MIDPLWILLAGMVVVVGGVLWLRLHAFLALILGALIVALLTPTELVEKFAVGEAAVQVVSVSGDGSQATIDAKKLVSPRAGVLLWPVELARQAKADAPPPVQLRLISVDPKDTKDRRAIAAIERSGGDLEIEKGTLVAEPLALADAMKSAQKNAAERVAAGFGRTCTSIGILIALAAIIGDCLLASGAADRIVRSTLKLMGEPRAPAAFMSSGFLLGIPVFFDTVFYLLIPLGKAMQLRTGRNYLLYVLTITAGATMTHSLVPPTPGPLFVASELGVNVGVMILGGLAVGSFTCLFGYFYAQWANRRWTLPLRDSISMPLAELEKLSQRDESQLPPTWLSLLPVVLPVLLIAGKTILDNPSPVVKFLGDKNIALLLGAAIALLTLAWQKKTSRVELAKAVQVALASGAVIILITAAGGAFGGVLRETNIGERIKQLAEAYSVTGLGILVLAFAVTTLIRTAQGSATVAMITAAGILSTFTSANLGYHPVYLALAIGCGSKPFAWMNDSGFWVIGKMSGMTEGETLKYITPMTSTMGFVGLAATLAGAKLFPLL